MTVTLVQSKECDNTVALLMNALADHQQAEQALQPIDRPTGRLGTVTGQLPRSEVRRHAVLVRAVSITESYLHRNLTRRLEALAPQPRTDFVESLYGQAEDKALSSWIELERTFRQHVHGVAIKKYGAWNKVEAIIEVRNAIVHGLGLFTARQRRRKSHEPIAAQLTALNYTLVKDGDTTTSFEMPDAALTQSCYVLRDYLYWLDLEIQKATAISSTTAPPSTPPSPAAPPVQTAVAPSMPAAPPGPPPHAAT